jgi:hypothetical protein
MFKDVEAISEQDDAVFLLNPRDAGLNSNRQIYSGDELGRNLFEPCHDWNVWGKWFDDGAECKVLSPGSAGWRKGKIYLRFAFVPDEELPTAVVQGELVVADDEAKQLPSSPGDSNDSGTE